MTLEEYMARFRLLQHAVDVDERNRKLVESDGYRSFVDRFSSATHPALRRFVVPGAELAQARERRKRLCERYATRIARAIALIDSFHLQQYARFHYLYGLTHEEIADVSFFSVRTVYRHAAQAKKEMEKCLLAVSPKRRRVKGAVFHVKGRLPRKDYRLDSRTRSVATLTARRKSEGYRPARIAF